MKREAEREAFEVAVYQKWADHFGCEITALHQAGTVVLPEAGFAGSGAVHVWVIGRRAFARLDPALSETVEVALAAQTTPVALKAAHLTPVIEVRQIGKVEDNVLTYLYPADLHPVEAPPGFEIRTLSTADAAALAALQAACLPEEVDEGEVSVEDEIGFGCFQGSALAAVATGFRLTGFMDIGVLTHPAFRRKSLGKAAVTALCRWCIDHDVIAQYRCRVDNVGSRSIAASLGFNLIFEQQSIYLSATGSDL
ncbi:MAG: GNAT family N-acetyltransferase [Anaerolineae bacterium]|nr:GNAT family N-acetyltransferase [Anaerolineae bacterium]